MTKYGYENGLVRNATMYLMAKGHYISYDSDAKKVYDEIRAYFVLLEREQLR